MRQLIIDSEEEANDYISRIYKTIDSTIKEIKSSSKNPIELFYDLKFNPIGKDPIFERPLNVIEQLNQTYTYIVSFKATIYLYQNIGYKGKIILNLGTVSGSDIEAIDGSLICEVFSATSVNSNQKLKKDIEKLLKTCNSAEKYIFFYTPVYEKNIVENYRRKYPNISIIRIDI